MSGLVRDARRLHNIASADLQEELILDDPLDSLKVLVHKGQVIFLKLSLVRPVSLFHLHFCLPGLMLTVSQFEAALRDLENLCPPDIDRSPTSLYFKAQKLLKIQIVLKHLRQESPALDEFEKCVKLLFRTNRGKVPVVDAAIVGTYNELIAVTASKKTSSAEQAKLIEGLLEKYGRDQFLQTFDEFVMLNQPPTMLDAVLADIESEFYVPRSAAASSDGTVGLGLPESAAAVEVGKAIKPGDSSPRLRASKLGGDTAIGQSNGGPRVQLSAWQLRKGLGLADDEEQWTAVHQVLRCSEF
jgi:hypothetical protein